MNRAMRRKMEKQLKGKLTDEQFQKIYDRAFHERVEERVSEIWEKMSPLLVKIMRENRISKERIRKILMEFLNEIKKEFGGNKNEDEGLFE